MLLLTKYKHCAFAFLSLNILFNNWLIYIPTIKKKLGIDEAELGIALFFFALGAFFAIFLTGKITDKIGEGKASFLGVLLMSITSILPTLAGSYGLLCASLFALGLSSGILDIAMNAMVSATESRHKAKIMSSSHGFFSIGGFIGAGLGGLLIPAFNFPPFHVFSVSLIILTWLVAYWPRFKNAPRHETYTAEKAKLNIGSVIFIILVGFFIMISEGAVTDWSTVYADQVLGLSPAYVGLGYAAFSAAMALGRFTGDIVTQKMSSIILIRWGIALGAIGLIFVVQKMLALSLLGFVIVGLGYSVVVPMLFRIGAQLEGIKPAQGTAAIAGSGYVGFLIGPVIMGFIADAFSLRQSFVMLIAFTVASGILSFFISLKHK
ncbi:MAG: MFS transporter [Bacteroidota bacterium]